ncbi:MAG: hybrid sensor histidine kinase/response regulator [Planctomycetota bacterium]
MSRTAKILIVDDDPVNVDILTENLKDSYSVVSVGTGLEALWILPKFRPDIVLLDILMPGMDGYEVCKRIRADFRHRLTKILLVSGKVSVEERLRGYEAGADDYITKPFVSEELLAKVAVFAKLKYAEEVDEIKSHLLRFFSQETGTPLTTIIGSADLLRTSQNLQPPEKELVSIIHESSKSLHEVVKMTMTLCRLKGTVELEKSRISLVEVLQTAAEVCNSRPEFARKELSFVLPEEDIQIYADSLLLTEAFINIMANQARFSPHGGKITASLRAKGATCQIELTDEGPEVSPDDAAKLFEEFPVGEFGRHSKSMGLGLSIARAIAELHGGDLKLDDSYQKGAKFCMVLPNTEV